MNKQAHPHRFGASISVDNVNEALPIVMDLLNKHGVVSTSRGIDTVRVDGPVMTIYHNPTRRVLFDQVRDANPFFHLAECMWILSGSNNIALPTYFLKRYADFSDDGVTTHGAYGYRLRNWPSVNDFGVLDQLEEAVKLLRSRPDTRQCVLSLWDPLEDLGAKSKDIPCNDMIMFEIVERRLNMTVCNRSNDIIWGAYGANVVHFSFLQEWVAVMVGCEVGTYTQFSNNFHVYPDNPFWKAYLEGRIERGEVHNPYMLQDCQPWPIARNAKEAEALEADAKLLNTLAVLGDPLASGPYTSDFFKYVMVPMIKSHDAYRAKDWRTAIKATMEIEAPDWRTASMQWIKRRAEKAQGAAR